MTNDFRGIAEMMLAPFGGWENQDTYDVAIALSTRTYGIQWREWLKSNTGLKKFCDEVGLPYTDYVNWDELDKEFSQRV